MNLADTVHQEFDRQGWCILPRILEPARLEQLRALVGLLSDSSNDGVRQKAGAVYAARNVLDVIPEVLDVWRNEPLVQFVEDQLGTRAGLVRILYFDKPPEQTWALPWHKDLLIAVQSDLPAVGYSTPRLRAGVWHTEPPLEVLNSMLTLRLHLDSNTPDNGPLRVATGSHKTGKTVLLDGFDDTTVLSEAGDVFVMTPLLVHCSGRSTEGATLHRRTLHLEFSALPVLPGGVQWNWFHPLRS